MRTTLRSYVTIGAHHHGPHVDALYALAERCGAEVIVVGPEGVGVLSQWSAPPTPPARAPYAGFDPGELRTWSAQGRVSR